MNQNNFQLSEFDKLILDIHKIICEHSLRRGEVISLNYRCNCKTVEDVKKHIKEYGIDVEKCNN